jgi:hypothetical protein
VLDTRKRGKHHEHPGALPVGLTNGASDHGLHRALYRGGAVLTVELLQGAVSIIVGCLFGMLAYQMLEALVPRSLYPARPRAVVLVPERVCRSLRCVFSGTSQHLVEVEVLEKTTRFLKVTWPRRFEHLEPWIQIEDVAGSLSAVNGIRVLEELPACPLWTSSEFEHWLSGVGTQLDALDGEPGRIVTADAGGS